MSRNSQGKFLKKTIGLVLLLGLPGLNAQLYFDVNGSTAGSGAVTANATYTWNGSNAYWTTDSAGTGTPGTWEDSSNIVFSAGTDGATTPYTLQLATAVTVTGITVTNGNVTINSTTGGSISLSGNLSVASTKGLNLDAPVGGADLTKTGSGTLRLRSSTPNTFTGNLTISEGNVSLSSTLSSAGVIMDSAGQFAIVTGGNFSSSAGLQINAGLVNISTAGNQTVASLSGTGGELRFGSQTVTIAQSANTSFSSTINASGGTLAKSGSGTLTLSGSSSWAVQNLSVSGGGLTLARTGSGTFVSAISVSGGGTLTLGQSSPFTTSPSLSSSSGNIVLSTAVNQSFGALTLVSSTTSTFDFGSTASTITFNGSSGIGTGLLEVTNYNHSGGSVLKITNLNTSYLPQIKINGLEAVFLTNSADGTLVAVPEPSVYAMLSGLVCLAVAVRRRLLPAKVSEA